MDIEEKYQSIGENYEEVFLRLSKKERVERFAKMFFNTGDFEILEKSIQEKDVDNVFEYAHRMKGNALNIGFNHFATTISNLVEYVRPKSVSDYSKVNSLYDDIKNEYLQLVEVFE